MPRRIKVEEGSGNVYADLGLPNPEEHLAKADVARQIIGIISGREMTQVETARILGIGQPRVSQLIRGRLGDFSLEKLIECAKALGNDVEIKIKPSTDPKLKVSTVVSGVMRSTSEYLYIRTAKQLLFTQTNPSGTVTILWSSLGTVNPSSLRRSSQTQGTRR